MNEVIKTCPCSLCLIKGVCEISCDLIEGNTRNETYKEDTYDSREEYVLKMRLIAGKFTGKQLNQLETHYLVVM